MWVVHFCLDDVIEGESLFCLEQVKLVVDVFGECLGEKAFIWQHWVTIFNIRQVNTVNTGLRCGWSVSKRKRGRGMKYYSGTSIKGLSQ